jgi:hypothetical protein
MLLNFEEERYSATKKNVQIKVAHTLAFPDAQAGRFDLFKNELHGLAC